MLSKMKKPDIREINLAKCKIPELKEIATRLGVRKSGKKEELKTRIRDILKQHDKAEIVQRVFRGHIVRLWIRLKRGPNTDLKSVVVNDSDFYTLEPVTEMKFIYYLHYTEDNKDNKEKRERNISYIFNINSLINLMMKTGKMDNPYTREDLTQTLSPRLMRIIDLTYILFPNNDLSRDSLTQATQITHVTALPLNPNTNYATLAIELFMKIDLLGNYTNIQWFNRLSNTQLCIFILRMFHFWNKIDRNLRTQICPGRGPFSTGNLGAIGVDDARTLAENRALVIRIGETMVCDGLTDEHKVLGAMYFLTVLTVVSNEARQQIPWLYDNYFVITNDA